MFIAYNPFNITVPGVQRQPVAGNTQAQQTPNLNTTGDTFQRSKQVGFGVNQKWMNPENWQRLIARTEIKEYDCPTDMDGLERAWNRLGKDVQKRVRGALTARQDQILTYQQVMGVQTLLGAYNRSSRRIQ